MNYGFMTFSYPDSDLSSILRYAKEFGYDGIELRIAAKHHHGIEIDTSAAKLREACTIASNEGIELYSIASSLQLAIDPLAGDDAERTLDLAMSIGAKVVRVFGGAFVDKGMDTDTATSNLVGGLQKLGELSDKHTDGVIIALESHDAWTDPSVLSAVVSDVNHPNVGLNWDPFHIVRTMNMSVEEHFPIIAKWIRHVHVHDGRSTESGIVLAPIGTGVVDHVSMIQCLKSIDFSGYLMGEWIHGVMEGETDPNVYLTRELKRMKEIESSLL